MNFNNNTIGISSQNVYSDILDNTSRSTSALIMTLEITNNTTEDAKVFFRRITNTQPNSEYFDSNVTVKTGTTILDHIIVIPSGQKYQVSSNKSNIIVSCSYAY